jgi:hypothetical protein
MLLKWLRVLLSLLLIPEVLCAQFEIAFDTPQPRRIRVFEKICADLYLNATPAIQREAFTALLILAEKRDDPQSEIYAKAWLATTEARLDTSLLKAYSAQMIGFIQQAKAYNHDILQAQLLIMLVDYLGDVHNHVGAALSYHILADEIMNRLQPDETPRSLEGLKHDLMIHLYEIGDYHRAKEIMENAAGMDLHPLYQLLYADLHSQLWLAYQQYDSSAHYIHQARNILDQDTSGIDRGWYGILEGNLAKIQYDQKFYAEAIPGFERAIAITNASRIYDVTASFGLMLANCYFQVDDIEKVRALMPLIRQAVYRQRKDVNFIDLYKWELVIGDTDYTPKRSLQLFDSLDIRKLSLAKQNDRNLLTKYEMEAEMTKYQARQDSMYAKIKRQLWLRNLLWAALGFALLIALFIFSKGNKRIRLEQQRSSTLQQQSEQELSASREQLLHFANSLQEKSRQIELLESNASMHDQHEALDHLRQSTILTEEDWGRFKVLFERAQPGFFTRLNERFANLTPGEMRFLALVKLSFTTREMASILGVSPVSVRSIRSRLLKKLDLSESENIEQLVSAI